MKYIYNKNLLTMVQDKMNLILTTVGTARLSCVGVRCVEIDC